MDTQATLVDTGLGNPAHLLSQDRLIQPTGPVVAARAIYRQHPSRSSDTQPAGHPQTLNQISATSRHYNFFRITSRSLSLSRIRSITRRRSRAFSSSSCLSLRTSEVVNPPSFFLQADPQLRSGNTSSLPPPVEPAAAAGNRIPRCRGTGRPPGAWPPASNAG